MSGDHRRPPSSRGGRFISSENAADLIALRQLIETGQVRPSSTGPSPRSCRTTIHDLIDGHAPGEMVITV